MHAVHRLSNASATLVERLAESLLSAVTSVFLARELGPSQFAEYALAFAVVAIVQSVSSFGLQPMMVERLARNDESFFRACVGFSLVLGTAAAVGTGIVCRIVFPGYGVSIQIALVSVAIIPIGFGNLYLVAREELHRRVVPGVAVQLFWAIAVVVMVQGVKSAAAFVALRVMLRTVSDCIAWRWIPRRLTRPDFGPKSWRDLAANAWPLALAGVATVMYYRLDQVLLGWLGERSSLGAYGAAVRVADVLQLLPLALMSSILPLMAGVLERQGHWKDRDIDSVFRAVGYSALAACFVVVASASVLLRALFGQVYADIAGMSLAVLALATVPISISILMFNMSIAARRNQLVLAATLLAVVINTAMDLVLIRRYGATGAAIASLVSYSAAALVPLLKVPRFRPAWGVRLEFGALCAGGGALLFIRPFSLRLLVGVVLAAWALRRSGVLHLMVRSRQPETPLPLDEA